MQAQILKKKVNLRKATSQTWPAKNQGTIGCTPNSVPMVFIMYLLCSLGILGDYNT